MGSVTSRLMTQATSVVEEIGKIPYLEPYADSKLFWVLSFLTFELVTFLFLERLLRSLRVGNYQEKYVLVTGCDSGLGQELAIHLDSLGFHVFAGCLTEDGRQYLSKNCSKRLVTVLLDVSKNESIEAALKLVKRTIPSDKGLWGLVNNAGVVGNPCVSEMCTRDDFLTVYNVNLFGMAEMCRHFLPLIRKARGRIVNMASVTGRIAFIMAPYTSTKWAIEAYSDVLRRELYSRGVRVSIIEAGGFVTPIFNEERSLSYVRPAFDRTPDEVKVAYGDVIGKFRDLLKKLAGGSSTKTYRVTDAYTHALTSRFPKTRYSVGIDSVVYLFLSYLPSRITDWMLQYQ